MLLPCTADQYLLILFFRANCAGSRNEQGTIRKLVGLVLGRMLSTQHNYLPDVLAVYLPIDVKLVYQAQATIVAHHE